MANKKLELSEMDKDAAENSRELTAKVFAQYQDSGASQESLAELVSVGTVQRVLYGDSDVKLRNWLAVVSRLGLKAKLVPKDEVEDQECKVWQEIKASVPVLLDLAANIGKLNR